MWHELLGGLASGSGEEHEEHSIFALPWNYNRLQLTWIVVALIGVTILYEQLTEWLEEHVFAAGIRQKIWQMMLRELTILGFVSFSATIFMQFVPLPEDAKLIFEYAHVLMFTLAIFYAVQIAITSGQLRGIAAFFSEQDGADDERLLAAEREWRRVASGGVGVRALWQRCTFLNRRVNRIISASTFKVLRFHFMARSALLGKARFDWAAYITRSMERHIEEMLEAMTLTMLGRDYMLLLSEKEDGEEDPPEFADTQGAWQGALMIVGTILPTLLGSFGVVPLALKNIALGHAASHSDTEVLQELEHEFEQSGDYAAASQALELAAASQLSEDDLKEEVVVRAKVQDMIKLGEMRWRYRVVDEGQSPRDEAIRLLDNAKELIESHLRVTTAGAHRKAWATELSEICQGLALARLIFNKDRSEDGAIASLLKEALALREDLRDAMKMAESLNSLGSLRQKQKAFKDAENYYLKSLELRRQAGISDDKAQAQAVAQSLTSLGNLYTELGDEASALADDTSSAPMEHGGAEDGREEERERRRAEQRQLRAQYFEQALSNLNAAKDAYIRGFSEQHPKVAWALEGIARVCQKSGRYREALSTWESVLKIRSDLQEASAGKMLFSNELEAAQRAKIEMEEARMQTRKRMANSIQAQLVTSLFRSAASSSPVEARSGVPPDAGNSSIQQ